ncbi:MAG: hypothetical protein HYV07_11200 [Deltaproteobacteria bacterium]|nr:hypothetical protein [Deltaproteobacteria bacterium]
MDRSTRSDALERLDVFLDELLEETGSENDAWDEFVGDFAPAFKKLEDAHQQEFEAFFDSWLVLDRRFDDLEGRLIEVLLEDARDLTPAVREYLERLSHTFVDMYEVEDVTPGQSLLLRGYISNEQVRVRDVLGSRSIPRKSVLLARVVRPGVSGEPELERGTLSVSRRDYEAFISNIERTREEILRSEPNLSNVEMARELTPVLGQGYLDAFVRPMPTVVASDGDPIVFSKSAYKVLDAARVKETLNQCKALEPSGDDDWSWVEERGGEFSSLANLVLKPERLFVETTSPRRAEQARAFVEGLLGDSVKFRAIVHQDLERAIEEHQARPPDPMGEEAFNPAIPEVEDALQAVLARHYRSWLDHEVPALDGATPRQAVLRPKLRAKLLRMLDDLEHMYYAGLSRGQVAFDPETLRKDLGLESPPEVTPPRLAHESIGRLIPGFLALARDEASRLRGAPDFDESKAHAGEELSSSLPFQRFLREYGRKVFDGGAGAAAAADDANMLGFWLTHAINFELHLRKTFWVGEGLSVLFDNTDADLPGELLRLPFPSFAIVFTDRHALGLCERILALELPGASAAGHKLVTLTAYVHEEPVEGNRALRVSLALDATGADWPYVLSRVMPIDPTKSVHEAIRAHLDNEREALDSPRLARLVNIVINAILYCTSAGIKIEAKKRPPRDPGKTQKKGQKQKPKPSDEVYFLPGTIDIQAIRSLSSIERAPDGRQILHRFMVRGHWRRANPVWKDQANRWIHPYWKGPDMAAIIERAYRLKAGDPAEGIPTSILTLAKEDPLPES